MNETYRKVSILIELERAIKYLRLGLSKIQNISPASDFHDPVFLYLSGGLERLFKTMLCLNFQEKNKRLPNTNEIWNNKNGHDLTLLKIKVEEICIPITRPFASMDYDIITTNDFTNQVCSTLAAFASRGRYFNIDAILGVDQEFDSKKAWEKMEFQIGKEVYGKEEFYKRSADFKQIDRIYTDTNREIVKRLEMFFRALTRQFIFGNFSSKSKSFHFEIESFSDINDNQLGSTAYDQFEMYERIKRKNKAEQNLYEMHPMMIIEASVLLQC